MELADNSSPVCDVSIDANVQDDEMLIEKIFIFFVFVLFESCMVLPLYHSITHPIHQWFPFRAINAQLDCL